jgi:hypothetical protein
MAALLRHLLLLVVCVFATPAWAQDKGPIQVASGVCYEFLARWDVKKLNQIL